MYTYIVLPDPKMNLQKSLKYNLPHIINDTPQTAKEKIYTRNVPGFFSPIYAKNIYLGKYNDTCTIQNYIIIHAIKINNINC